jgi:hypothetical protein
MRPVERKIIDCHAHVFANPPDPMARECERLGIVRMVLLGHPPNRRPDDNAAVLRAARDYPALYVPFAGFDLDGMTAEDVDRFRDAGYRGLKFIGPARAYNDPAYFPVYERAAQLGTPVLFHLGILANKPPWTDCDSNLMRPIHLDHIARRVPELSIIGAHLGNPWYEEATMACRWNPNLRFDLSGSTLKKKTPEFLGRLLWWTEDTAYTSPDRTPAWGKIVFGSDVPVDRIGRVVRDYEQLMDALDLADDLRRAIWYDTARAILGLEA